MEYTQATKLKVGDSVVVKKTGELAKVFNTTKLRLGFKSVIFVDVYIGKSLYGFTHNKLKKVKKII